MLLYNRLTCYYTRPKIYVIRIRVFSTGVYVPVTTLSLVCGGFYWLLQRQWAQTYTLYSLSAAKRWLSAGNASCHVTHTYGSASDRFCHIRDFINEWQWFSSSLPFWWSICLYVLLLLPNNMCYLLNLVLNYSQDIRLTYFNYLACCIDFVYLNICQWSLNIMSNNDTTHYELSLTSKVKIFTYKNIILTAIWHTNINKLTWQSCIINKQQ